MTDRIKKLLMSIAALAALAAGGAAYAGAQGSPTATSSATPASSAGDSETGTAADPADDPADKNEGTEQTGEHGDGNDNVTGDAAAKAKAAALAEVPGGKVGDISAEQPDASKGTDKPEAGDTPDPAYESKIAYDVEVTQTDGNVVSVHLDKAFAVLGTTKEDAEGHDGENAKD
jgi:hypothetical protein